MTTIHTTYQLRGYLSKSGYARLDDVLSQCAVLYNAGLQEWRDSYSTHVGWSHLMELDDKGKQTGERARTRDGKDWVYIPQRAKRIDAKPPTYYDQLKEFTGVRADDSYWDSLDVNVGRGVLQRLERSKNSFFRRVKAGEKAGYPRWKSGRRWKTIEMAMVRPGMVKNGQVKIKGLPPIEIPSKRELPPSADLKTLRITRAGRRVMVSMGYAVEREPLPYNPSCVGIDMGITDRMVLSTGQIMMAGGDRPAADLESAEIPISGQPIITIGVQGVAPDVAESPVAVSNKKVRRRVAPDVAESPHYKEVKPDLLGVAPDVAESPNSGNRVVSLAAVAPDVAESPKTAKDNTNNVQVAPDVAESLHIKRRRVNRLALAKKQQRLARCQKYSQRWKQRARILANTHSRTRISNRNECHRITTDIIHRFGHIGIEALQIRNMTRSAAGTLEEPGRNVSAKSGLNREILTQTWGVIHQQLAYKAEWAGRRLVKVHPRDTSIICSACGVIYANSRNKKAFNCTACGYSDDADHNAAVNILRMSLAGGNAPPLARESS